ncbi:hypothetical protein EM20IM_06050 [Candidatus Methylacidiphilum infernorum]|uniref:Uncharacterized protein n=1 Tax=Candidatus Methylacidiphilum infernorum TaxID=511746 RepID=A0ABX7PSX0_9BACT|nr:hypothetical protein [Candidatus Methylacidiphilum infernorum]QSR86074.1 hypothetical protein EM20IM_06050 [Candidatus Methylacidiphilum infernorum]
MFKKIIFYSKYFLGTSSFLGIAGKILVAKEYASLERKATCPVEKCIRYSKKLFAV